MHHHEGAPLADSRSMRATTWLLLTAFGALSLLTAGQGYLARRATAEETPVFVLAGVGAASWVSWLALAPLVIAVGRRFPFSRTTWRQAAAVHTVTLLCCYVVSILVFIWLSTRLLAPTEPVTFDMAMRTLLTSSRLSLAIFTYATILATDRVLLTREVLRWRELQAIRLAQLATQSRLDALAARLEPHFLFNTLQSVSALVDTDPLRARTMLAQLGDLLRDALSSPGTGDVRVQEELRLLSRYLAIEETRFADRLLVEWDIAPDATSLAVPRFLLQPLAENALRHGLAPKTGRGRLRISAERTGPQLQLVIWNDGVPLPAMVREGVGLATTRERLLTRYGTVASLTLRTTVDGGVATVIDVPAIEAPPLDAPPMVIPV